MLHFLFSCVCVCMCNCIWVSALVCFFCISLSSVFSRFLCHRLCASFLFVCIAVFVCLCFPPCTLNQLEIVPSPLCHSIVSWKTKLFFVFCLSFSSFNVDLVFFSITIIIIIRHLLSNLFSNLWFHLKRKFNLFSYSFKLQFLSLKFLNNELAILFFYIII